MSYLHDSYQRSAFWGKPIHRPEIDARFLSAEEDTDGNVTLVVVDMQPGCQDAIDTATLEAVERQILLAISKGRAIVVLEKEPWRFGPTHPQLMRHLTGKYQRHMMRVKAFDNGAPQVIEACMDFHYPMTYFHLCGVYADWCVTSTGTGLVFGLPGCVVRVIAEACNTIESARAQMWSKLPKVPHIVISSQHVSRERD